MAIYVFEKRTSKYRTIKQRDKLYQESMIYLAHKGLVPCWRRASQRGHAGSQRDPDHPATSLPQASEGPLGMLFTCPVQNLEATEDLF